MANGLARDRREGDVFCLFQQVSQTAAAAAGVGRGDHRSSSFLSLILHFNGSNAANLETKTVDVHLEKKIMRTRGVESK